MNFCIYPFPDSKIEYSNYLEDGIMKQKSV